MKRLFLTTIVIMLVMLVFTGQSGSPRYRDTIVYANNTDVITLDPQQQTDTTSEEVVKMLYNNLMTFALDGSVVPDLAREYRVSADKLTWTFRLREGVRFHNGKELTSVDVKATFDRLLDPNSKLVTRTLVSPFKSVDIIDRYTVSITTKEPYGPMLPLLSNAQVAIIDADMAARYGAEIGKDIRTINGTGPYKITSWKRDEEIVLERHVGHFKGDAFTKYIKLRPIPEPASRVIALETGEVDAIKQIPSEEFARLKNRTRGITILQQPSAGQRIFRFGVNDPIINNVKVRQAILYALDREIIIESLFPGQVTMSTSTIGKPVFGYTDLGPIRQDKARARRLLAEAGYPNGFKTKITTTTRYANGVQLAEIMAAQLAEFGIQASIEVIEWSTLLPLWRNTPKKDFNQPMFIGGMGTSMLDADGAYRGLYDTVEDDMKEKRNYGFYSNKEVDALIAAGMKETDPEKRKAIYKRVQEITYLEDPFGIWLFDTGTELAVRTKLSGVSLHPSGAITFEFARLEQ
jgi:peptide/nickel transport system substrate-binding protein